MDDQPRLGLFTSGVGAGAWFIAGIVIFQHVDPLGARLNTGLDGELFTATALRKLRRQGWRVVHNLHFERGDVDHVAVGPGGVVVIESKSSGSDWSFLEREGVARRWARQAHDGAFRVRNLVKSRCGHDVTPVPLVTAWCPGQVDDHALLEWGVVRVRGGALRPYVESLPAILDPHVIDEITKVLEAASGDFDHARGIASPGWFRRVLEAGR